MEAVNKKQLGIVKGKVTKAEKIAGSLVINNQADYEKAGKEYLVIKKLEKEFKAEYDSWMKPINELRAKVFANSRPIQARFKAALNTLNDMMLEFEMKVEEQRQADAAKLEAQVDSGEKSLPQATDEAGKLETVDPVATSAGKLGQQVRHELKITDESKLDRKYLMPDIDKIKAHYQATGLLPAGVVLEKKVVRTARLT